MFNKLREKTGKQFVKKYQSPFGPLWSENSGVYKSQVTGQYVGTPTFNMPDMAQTGIQPQSTELFTFGSEDSSLGQTTVSATALGVESANSVTGTTTLPYQQTSVQSPGAAASKGYNVGNAVGSILTMKGAEYNNSVQQTGMNAAAELGKYAAQNGGSLKGAMSNGSVTGAIGSLANAGLDKIENLVMGDKTFDRQSEAIDDAVRMASQELSKKWPPWGLLAAGVVETLNFADKAAGKSVQGFEVGDSGSGFQGIDTTQDTLSYRGSQTGKMKRDLARRNEQMNMAMMANQVNEEESFQMQARMSSINNVMEANRIALAGGVDTSLLGG